MALGEVTVSRMITLTEKFFDERIFSLEVDPEIIKKAYPWHSIFFSPEAAIAALKERSMVTSIGMVFVPQLAKIVAEDSYKDVHLNYELNCTLDEGAMQQIDTICRELRRETGSKTRVPNHDREIEEINNARVNLLNDMRLVLDLYVGDHKNGPLYYEIKSPKPNLDQTELTKKKILQFMSISPNHKGFYALHYNPYITKKAYKWSFTKSIMDMDKQVLLGEEMWNYLGNENTYTELISILTKVSEEKWNEFENREKKLNLFDS